MSGYPENKFPPGRHCFCSHAGLVFSSFCWSRTGGMDVYPLSSDRVPGREITGVVPWESATVVIRQL
ncbi:MAG: hypothetical protein XD51_0664 [Moorella sp. 60_41]|nr:MAG: hypothetical protein XD51_0664 [Moorella sp. 60_41]